MTEPHPYHVAYYVALHKLQAKLGGLAWLNTFHKLPTLNRKIKRIEARIREMEKRMPCPVCGNKLLPYEGSGVYGWICNHCECDTGAHKKEWDALNRMLRWVSTWARNNEPQIEIPSDYGLGET